jgi:hypothetical protein
MLGVTLFGQMCAQKSCAAGLLGYENGGAGSPRGHDFVPSWRVVAGRREVRRPATPRQP